MSLIKSRLGSRGGGNPHIYCDNWQNRAEARVMFAKRSRRSRGKIGKRDLDLILRSPDARFRLS